MQRRLLCEHFNHGLRYLLHALPINLQRQRDLRWHTLWAPMQFGLRVGERLVSERSSMDRALLCSDAETQCTLQPRCDVRYATKRDGGVRRQHVFGSKRRNLGMEWHLMDVAHTRNEAWATHRCLNDL